MLKTTILCDICRTDCSADPYGVSFGTMLDVTKHITVHLCKEHMDTIAKTMSATIFGPSAEDFGPLEEQNGETS